MAPLQQAISPATSPLAAPLAIATLARPGSPVQEGFARGVRILQDYLRNATLSRSELSEALSLPIPEKYPHSAQSSWDSTNRGHRATYAQHVEEYRNYGEKALRFEIENLNKELLEPKHLIGGERELRKLRLIAASNVYGQKSKTVGGQENGFSLQKLETTQDEQPQITPDPESDKVDVGVVLAPEGKDPEKPFTIKGAKIPTPDLTNLALPIAEDLSVNKTTYPSDTERERYSATSFPQANTEPADTIVHSQNMSDIPQPNLEAEPPKVEATKLFEQQIRIRYDQVNKLFDRGKPTSLNALPQSDLKDMFEDLDRHMNVRTSSLARKPTYNIINHALPNAVDGYMQQVDSMPPDVTKPDLIVNYQLWLDGKDIVVRLVNNGVSPSKAEGSLEKRTNPRRIGGYGNGFSVMASESNLMKPRIALHDRQQLLGDCEGAVLEIRVDKDVFAKLSQASDAYDTLYEKFGIHSGFSHSDLRQYAYQLMDELCSNPTADTVKKSWRFVERWGEFMTLPESEETRKIDEKIRQARSAKVDPEKL